MTDNLLSTDVTEEKINAFIEMQFNKILIKNISKISLCGEDCINRAMVRSAKSNLMIYKSNVATIIIEFYTEIIVTARACNIVMNEYSLFNRDKFIEIIERNKFIFREFSTSYLRKIQHLIKSIRRRILLRRRNQMIF
jgi:hypothetical protein